MIARADNFVRINSTGRNPTTNDQLNERYIPIRMAEVGFRYINSLSDFMVNLRPNNLDVCDRGVPLRLPPSETGRF
jgi:hypothetical protein